MNVSEQRDSTSISAANLRGSIEVHRVARGAPRARILVMRVVTAAVGLSLLACGSVVSSRRSIPQYSPHSPITIGDVIFYNLPVGLIKVDGIYDEKKGWIVTVAPEIRADLGERYELALNQRYPFFDHNATLTTDDKGLLKTVYAVSTDRTVDSIGAAITAAGQVLQFAASMDMAPAADGTEPAPQPFHVTLDPFNGPWEERGGIFTIQVNAPPEPVSPRPQDEAAGSAGRFPGIMTRLPMAFTVTISPVGGTPAAKTTVLLPDIRQRYLLSVPRGPLVASETKIEFANGSMVSRDMKRPSVGYAILGIPKTLLSALVPIPGQVRQAEITRIQNQSTLIKETTELGKLQNPSPTPTPTPTATP